MGERLEFREIKASTSPRAFCEAVEHGLSQPQKTLPSRYFYDDAGSALFERITKLPEYYLTGTELAILHKEAPEILATTGENIAIIEFGSGSSMKTRVLIEAALARQSELVYAPIDISRDFLRASSETLLREYPRLRISALAAEYTDAIRHLPEHDGPRLLLFLGSNVGNFEQAEAVEFLSAISGAMKPEDRLLMGADMVKDPAVIEPAYNDAAGVTAEFNLNFLRRINRELDGHFHLPAFEHHAPYLAAENRVEMRLVSTNEQTVEIEAIGEAYAFRRGEFIHTEYSQKYTRETLAELCRASGLRIGIPWQDPLGWFSLALLAPERG